MTEQETVDRRWVMKGPAAKYIVYDGREALCEGPTRAAKSFSLLIKMNEVARNHPGSRQLMARQTRKSLNESVLRDWREEILWQGHPAIRATAGRDHQDLYVYPNRSEVFFAGLDAMADTSSPILSTKWDRIYVIQCEESTESAWETLATRLSSFKTPYHQMTADCNPAAPSHWLNRRFNIQTKTGRSRFRFRHWDNPLFYNGIYPNGEWTKEGVEYVGGLESTLTGIRYKRFYLGQWASADGLILDNWDPEKHVINGECFQRGNDWFIKAAGVDTPIRVAYFTAGVDWGWHPDPGAMCLWAYDSPRWHPKIRRFRVAEVCKLRWQREEWGELACEWAAKYGVKFFSCDRSNPEAISYFNLKLGKRIGLNSDARAVKCPPIGGGHRSGKDKDNQIDLMRNGLGDKSGHQRTYLLADSFPLGKDEELRTSGRPTCYEEEVESWSFLRPRGAERESPKPDDKCDDHILDSARYDEVFNFARGFGSEAVQQGPAVETYQMEWDQHLREQKDKKRKWWRK